MKNDSFVLLEIAFEDYRSSVLLFENDLNPQAIFYLQQSVEKTIKYLGITQEIVKPSALQGEISHKAEKIFKKLVKRISPYLGESGMNIDSEYEKLKNLINSADTTSLKDSVIEIFEDWKNKEFEIEIYDEFLKMIIDNEYPKFGKQLKENKEIRESFEVRKNQFFKHFPDYIKGTMILFLINLLVSDYVTAVRYPNMKTFENPSHIYNSKHFLVELLPILHKNLKFAIKGISNTDLVSGKI